ncbi:UNVERIFIED_CONTAM: hypothetical protein RMT77_018564 [Armadillidium vulgare]
MDIKSEIEIKMEELVPDYDFSQDYQSFSHIESIIPLPESIKRELDGNSSFIKSEPRESDLEFVFNEEKVENDVIKSENSSMKKFDLHHVMQADDDDSDDLRDNRSITEEEIDETMLLSKNDHDMEEVISSFQDEEEFEGFIHSDNFKERSNLLNKMILQLRNLQSTSMINAAEGEKDLEVKSTSRSKPQRAEVHQQSIKKYHLENLSCKYCNFSFKSKDELKTHLKTHNKRKFKCAHCSYECKFKSVLKNHMLIHSNIKLYKCSHCSYECNRKGNLKIHMLSHANAKLFNCSDCSYECNQKGHLKSHMLTHTNVKLFKCSYCSYECNRKDHLKSHMLTHTNVKLFKCSYCSYESNHKSHLKTHILTHTHVKLFKCSDCSYKCNWKGNLKMYMLIHTNVKLYKCSYCSYECNQKGNLRRHMLRHAKNSQKREHRTE